jgi:cell wall-associated NlpC family hydrolase
MSDQEQRILKFLGKPFVEKEFDCYDLLVQWFKESGISIPDFRSHRQQYWDGDPAMKDVRNFFKLWTLVPKEEILSDDVIFMKNIFRPESPYHVGIVLDKEKFIHCDEQVGVVVDRTWKYKRLIHGFYRYKGESC